MNCDDSDDELNNKTLSLRTAKCIIDSNCYIYKPQVLNLLKVGDEVRISFTVETDEDCWTHDNPYVEIVEIDNENVLGEILDINRQETDMYPLDIGEKIWFRKNNIIEVPINHKPSRGEVKKWNEIKSMLTNKKVSCTGPLFTVIYPDSDDEKSEESIDENNTESSVSDSN